MYLFVIELVQYQAIVILKMGIIILKNKFVFIYNSFIHSRMCTWRNFLLFGNATWFIGSGSAKPPYNGPQNDHTLGLNNFVFRNYE